MGVSGVGYLLFRIVAAFLRLEGPSGSVSRVIFGTVRLVTLKIPLFSLPRQLIAVISFASSGEKKEFMFIESVARCFKPECTTARLSQQDATLVIFTMQWGRS